MPVPTVVYDLTPLETDSRLRGFGRYVVTLARAIAAVPRAERNDLRILGLVRLTWGGAFAVTEDLASYAGKADLVREEDARYLEWAWRRRVALGTALRRIGADLVHLGTPDGTPLSLGGAKKVVTCHDLIEFALPDRYLGWNKLGPIGGPAILRRRYRSADHVIAISDATAGDLRRHLGVETVTRVWNAVDPEVFRPGGEGDDDRLARHGLSRGGYLFYVGDVDWRKNLEGMVAGLAHARGRGSSAILALAGALAPEKIARVERAAAEAGVRDAVVRLGFVPDEDLPALYRGALGHLFVSRFEGFGLTVVEAMACGTPVITTRGGSLGEVAGRAARLVDPEDHAAIGDAILSLGDRSVRADLVRAGIERARLFTPRAQAEATLDVYRKVLALPHSSPTRESPPD